MMNLADVKSFEYGMNFYDEFRSRIAECEKENQGNLKQELEENYKKITKNLKKCDKDSLYKIYIYLLGCFE